MKKALLTLLMFAVTATVFTGCKKDKDDDNGSIEGTWRSTKEVYYATVNGTKHGDEEVENHSEARYDILTLSGGKYTVKEYYDGELEDTDEGKYTYSNGQLVIDGETTLKVKISGNTLVIVSEELVDGEAKAAYVHETHYVKQ